MNPVAPILDAAQLLCSRPDTDALQRETCAVMVRTRERRCPGRG